MDYATFWVMKLATKWSSCTLHALVHMYVCMSICMHVKHILTVASVEQSLLAITTAQ